MNIIIILCYFLIQILNRIRTQVDQIDMQAEGISQLQLKDSYRSMGNFLRHI